MENKKGDVYWSASPTVEFPAEVVEQTKLKDFKKRTVGDELAILLGSDPKGMLRLNPSTLFRSSLHFDAQTIRQERSFDTCNFHGFVHV